MESNDNYILPEDEMIFENYFLLKSQEKYEAAFNILFPLQKLYPHNSKIKFLLGIAQYEIGNYSSAISYFKKVLARSSGHKLASLCFFHCQMNLGKTHIALVELERYIKEYPKTSKEHWLTVKELFENIHNFSTSERGLINRIYSSYNKRQK